MANRATVTLLSALALAACTSSTSGRLFNGSAIAQSTALPIPQPTEGASTVSEDVGMYLQMMRDLIEGDEVLQADTFRSVADAVSSAPTTTNRVRYALALATPGHPGTNLEEAQQRLSEVLAAGSALLPEERALVTVQLKEVEHRLILDSEARRLQRELEAATTAQDTESAQRLQAALDENRRLEAELKDAREKLDAITNIERSIRERENGTDPE
jgi:hypothetical protein